MAFQTCAARKRFRLPRVTEHRAILHSRQCLRGLLKARRKTVPDCGGRPTETVTEPKTISKLSAFKTAYRLDWRHAPRHPDLSNPKPARHNGRYSVSSKAAPPRSQHHAHTVDWGIPVQGEEPPRFLRSGYDARPTILKRCRRTELREQIGFTGRRCPSRRQEIIPLHGRLLGLILMGRPPVDTKKWGGAHGWLLMEKRQDEQQGARTTFVRPRPIVPKSSAWRSSIYYLLREKRLRPGREAFQLDALVQR